MHSLSLFVLYFVVCVDALGCEKAISWQSIRPARTRFVHIRTPLSAQA